MIDISKEPVIEQIPGRSFEFTVNWRSGTKDYKYVSSSNDIFSMYSEVLAGKLSTSSIKSSVLSGGSGVVMTFGEHKHGISGRQTLWGCEAPNNMNPDFEIRSMTGEISFRKVGLTPGIMFDSRILLPWCLDIKRSKTEFDICLIPSYKDIRFLEIKNKLESNGMHVLNPNSHIRTHAHIISLSGVIITSSLSDFIIADAMGVPAYMFHTGDNYNEIHERLSDYYSAFSLNCPEILDFSSSISTKSLPQNMYVSVSDVKDKLHQYLSVSPFPIRPDVESEIGGHLDALS